MASKLERDMDVSWTKRTEAYGRALMRWTPMTSDYIGDDMQIREIRVKTPLTTGNEYLVIMKPTSGGRKVIAFHGAATYEDAMAGALDKLEKNLLNWKEDRPYGQPSE